MVRTIPCKIYNDGSHYIATRIIKGHGKSYKIDKPESKYFEEAYKQSFEEKIEPKNKPEYIKKVLQEQHPEIEEIDKLVDEKLETKTQNYYQRIKRFRRKANLNEWNYFVTLTYDSKKMDEETFRKKIRKCLSNLHSRHQWKYMGVFEKGNDTDRLHFHAIMYIPSGQMIGSIVEKKDYSTEHKKMQISHINTFFEKYFGRNDFTQVSKAQLKLGNGLNYIIKYLSKNNERIIYSRGLRSEIEKDIDVRDIVTEMEDFVTKYILFDDVID